MIVDNCAMQVTFLSLLPFQGSFDFSIKPSMKRRKKQKKNRKNRKNRKNMKNMKKE